MWYYTLTMLDNRDIDRIMYLIQSRPAPDIFVVRMDAISVMLRTEIEQDELTTIFGKYSSIYRHESMPEGVPVFEDFEEVCV